MNIAFTEEQLMIIILSLLFVIAIIVIVIEWRKNAVSKNNVLLLEKKTELKKIELVEKDLENKRRKEDMSDLSEEDQERLRQIRINTAEIIKYWSNRKGRTIRSKKWTIKTSKIIRTTQ